MLESCTSNYSGASALARQRSFIAKEIFTTPDEGEFCLTEILGNKIITLLSCPISLAIGFLFYSTLLILINTKIRLHLATVCPSGPCIELPNLVNPGGSDELGPGHKRPHWRMKNRGVWPS